MKRFLCALLAVLMLCTMAVSMVSCSTSMESIEETCKKLKEDKEITDYTVYSAEFIAAYMGDKVKAAIEVDGEEKAYLTAVEYKEKDAAKEAYDEQKELIDKAKEAGTDVSNVKLVRKGNIVIYSNSKDLYKKVI